MTIGIDSARDIQHRLLVILALIVGLTALNLAFHSLFEGPDRFKGLQCYPGYGFMPGPLFHSWDRFMDYFNLQQFRPYETSALPPTLIVAYQLAHRLTALIGPELSAMLFSLLQVSLFCASLYCLLSLGNALKAMCPPYRIAFATLIALCSYPVYFAIDRGSFALIVCALLNFAVYAHFRERKWLAGILIGLAAALRITPLLFAAIYLGRKDFRYLLAAVVTTLAVWGVSVPAASALLGGYGLGNWLDGLSDHSFMYTTWTNGMAWSSSLYNSVRFVRYLLGIPPGAVLESAYLAEKMFSLFSLVTLILVAFRLRRLEAVTAFSLLAWAFVALPHVTGDYYLAVLIGPMLLLAVQLRVDILSVALIVLLLVPKDYFYYYFLPHKLFDFQIMDAAQYRYLLARGYMPSSIQSLVINPMLLAGLGIRLYLLNAVASVPTESRPR